jgi:hypothetical protein
VKDDDYYRNNNFFIKFCLGSGFSHSIRNSIFHFQNYCSESQFLSESESGFSHYGNILSIPFP